MQLCCTTIRGQCCTKAVTPLQSEPLCVIRSASLKTHQISSFKITLKLFGLPLILSFLQSLSSCASYFNLWNNSFFFFLEGHVWALWWQQLNDDSMSSGTLSCQSSALWYLSHAKAHNIWQYFFFVPEVKAILEKVMQAGLFYSEPLCFLPVQTCDVNHWMALLKRGIQVSSFDLISCGYKQCTFGQVSSTFID